MATLKASTAPQFTLADAASASGHVVRKQEFDAAIADLPTSSSMAAAIADVTHNPVTVFDSESCSLRLTGQSLTVDLILPAQSVLQASATGAHEDFIHPVAGGSTLTLAKQFVSGVSVKLYTGGGSDLVLTGAEGTDYSVDYRAGVVTIIGSALATSSSDDLVRVAYDAIEIREGPGLIIGGGVAAEWGTAHHQIPRGDHIHANDHKAVTPDSAAVTTTTTVSADQKIKVEVKRATGSGLLSVSDGLKVDPDAYSAVGHSHDDATTSDAGFMSAEDKTKLDSLSNSPANFIDTDSVNWDQTIDGVWSAIVRTGAGIAPSSAGVEVDFNAVASKTHVHAIATSLVAGFMSAADKIALDAAVASLTSIASDVTALGFLTALTGGTSSTLDGQVTVGRINLLAKVVIGTALTFWKLRAGTDAAGATIVRPTDYDDTTNQKVWEKLTVG